jgi:hypothetical protein
MATRCFTWLPFFDQIQAGISRENNMREHHPEQNERAMVRTANAVEPSVDTSHQMLPIPRAFDGVDHLRMKSALDTLAHQAGLQANGGKLSLHRLKKDNDEDQEILLAQAPADTSNHNNAPPSEKAISVVSEAAFNPECTATTADGCGLAVGAAGSSVAIAPWLFLPLLALGGGGGGGGSSEPPPTLNFTSGPGLFDADSLKKVNVSKNEFKLDFDTDKDLTGKVRYELSSSTDSQNKHGATIDPKTGVIKFSSFDKFCIGDELEFTVKAIYEDGAKKATSTYTFSIDVIGPLSSINAMASNAHVFNDDSILSGGADLDTLTFDFEALSLDPAQEIGNVIHFGRDGVNTLCIRFGDKYVEFNTSTVEYIYFGAVEDYNTGDPTAYLGSIFGYELNEIYKVNQTSSLADSTLTVGGSLINCDQLLFGVWDSSWATLMEIDSTTLLGGSGHDLIFGSETGFNELVGGAGDDFIMAISKFGNILNGGEGSDVLIGSSGEDTFVYSKEEFGKDRILADINDIFEIDGSTFEWNEDRWTSSGSNEFIIFDNGKYLFQGAEVIAFIA